MNFNLRSSFPIRYPQALLVAGLLLSWWLLNDQAAEQSRGIDAPPHRPDFWTTHFTTVALDIGGKPRYQLTAAEMVHFRDDATSEFDHPKYVRYQQEQGPITITAVSGWNNKEGTELVLTDKVVIVSQGDSDADKVTAEMDKLLLFPEDDYAETDTPVKIVSPSGTTTGIGMQVNSRTGVLILLSNVHGIYEPPR
ncbi:MAG: LPS export ABC transporter periplasmic protein LptC [Gammaproteobacteria bacterium]|nr:MAG: LPS export ABC transporter periplasmic protein LptC [Gammaproteobacteria bacterium]RLA09631.1 MAG: LPS export ABC transporter periplasmic protein LptC [Gammaproteobacteria bacterium]RLA14178.1 MAG: LPS export ABC transporter periplasmic protein LptC [Gammaproteobacteria bacterium]